MTRLGVVVGYMVVRFRSRWLTKNIFIRHIYKNIYIPYEVRQ